MVAPLVALAGILAAQSAVSAGVNLYNQHQQRKVFKMQEEEYDRYSADFKRNTGRDFAYPGIQAPGRAYAARVGQNQSYASGIGSIAEFGSGMYGASKSLYGNPGRGYRRF